MTWYSPTGHNDPDSKWHFPEKAYDEDVNTYTLSWPEPKSWSSFLEFTHKGVWCTKVGFLVQVADYITSVDIDAFYDDVWNDVYEGSFASAEWVEILLAEEKRITAFRFRFYNNHSEDTLRSILNEVSFYGTLDLEVNIQPPTYVLPTTVTANGNIVYTGGGNCSKRGFQYGFTKWPVWDVYDEGDYESGTFSKGLTDLQANTIYWIRAYAINIIGIAYSKWIQFQTAAAGIIPTGTLINICSDYSGYTYKLMRSETDDGETYTAYFVISTDLANKQGLSYYKRILDMDLYFNNEDSGTVTISVKKDNETTWEELGSVSLAGDDDIIIKHLAVDVRAKHFLFKISASNHFEFLGVLFQFIPAGMR